MDSFLFFIILLLVGGATGYFANKRGRNPSFWFFIGFLFGIFGFIALFLLPNVAETPQKESAFPTTAISVYPTSAFDQYEWFYIDAEKNQQGPLSFLDMKLLWSEQKIDTRTYVWYQHLEEWKRIAEVQDLEENLTGD